MSDVARVEGEVVDKTYGEIVEEVRRKLEKFGVNDYPWRSNFCRENLVILIPEKEYNKVMNPAFDYFNPVDMKKGFPNMFGVRIELAQVNKIYVAYDEPEGRY